MGQDLTVKVGTGSQSVHPHLSLLGVLGPHFPDLPAGEVDGEGLTVLL